MAVSKTFRPAQMKLAAATVGSVYGQVVNLATKTLSKWNRILVFANVQNIINNGNITNAGVEIYLLAATGNPLTAGVYQSTVYTDAYGEYGVSLAAITGTQNYAFKVVTPGN